MSPTTQCSEKKNLRDALFFSLQFHSQLASTQIRGYIPHRTGCVVPCHAKKKKSHFSYALSLKTRARETIPMSTRNFPPRHQVSSGAQVMPSDPECALDK